MINYDDAFIAYLNGKEVLRVGVGQGRDARSRSIASHEAKGYTYFPLEGAADLLLSEDNMLAIEGHNVKPSSSDFTLDPYLVVIRKGR